MRKLVAVMVLVLGCGGEMELGTAEQAVVGTNEVSGKTWFVSILSDYGMIGNGIVMDYTPGDSWVLFNSFHDNLDQWADAEYVRLLDRSDYIHSFYPFDNDCEELLVWKICPAPIGGPSHSDVSSYPYTWTSLTETSYTNAIGAGSVCNSNTKGTNPALWTFEDGPYQGSYPAMKQYQLYGMRNYGSNNLCTSPYGLAAWCFDFDTGSTCMWGDDGASAAKYSMYVYGLTFGNKGAAWVNSTVASWLNAF